MKEEIIKLWNEYLVDCSNREREYFQYVMKNYGPSLYAPNKENQPSFEGFMTHLSTQVKE